MAGLAGGGEQSRALAASAGQQIPGASRSRQYLELPAGIGISVDSENVEAAWEFSSGTSAKARRPTSTTPSVSIPRAFPSAAALNEEGVIQGYDEIVEQSMHTNELPRFALWWGPWAAFVSEEIKEAMQTGAASDDLIDALAADGTSSRKSTSKLPSFVFHCRGDAYRPRL